MSQPSKRLQNRIAIVTGSSGALGRAICLLFASEGAKVICVDKYATPRNPVNPTTGKADDWENRLLSQSPPDPNNNENNNTNNNNDKPNDTTPTHILINTLHGPKTATFHQTDLTSEPAVQTLFQTLQTHHERLDILINAHGISLESTHATPLRCHDLPLSDFTLTTSINTTTLFLTCKYFLAQILKQSQLYDAGAAWIVNVASVQGLTPYYCTTAYCASKGAVVMLTRQIALDYAADGVRVNAVCPGFLDTNMTRNLQAEEEVVRGVMARQPLRTGRDGNDGKGRLGDVRDVARICLVLASDDAAWVTGQALGVDGGYMLT